MKCLLFVLTSFLPLSQVISQSQNNTGFTPSKYEQFIDQDDNLITTDRTNLFGTGDLYIDYYKSTNTVTKEYRSAVVIHIKNTDGKYAMFPLGIVIDREDLKDVIAKLNVIFRMKDRENQEETLYTQKLTEYLSLQTSKNPGSSGDQRSIVLHRVNGSTSLSEFCYVQFSIRMLEELIIALERARSI